MEVTNSKWSGNVEVQGLEGLGGGNIFMNVLCEMVESTIWLCPWEGLHGVHAQSCPTLWDPMDCSPPGSSVRRILWARILEWVAIPCSNGSSWPRDQNQVSYTAGGFFAVWATREALKRDGMALKTGLGFQSPTQRRVTCAGPVGKKLFFPLITLFTHLTWQVRRVRMLWMVCETEV